MHQFLNRKGKCPLHLGFLLLKHVFSQNFDPSVKEKASIYVPAIGKVTIVMLLRNLVVRNLSI